MWWKPLAATATSATLFRGLGVRWLDLRGLDIRLGDGRQQRQLGRVLPVEAFAAPAEGLSGQLLVLTLVQRGAFLLRQKLLILGADGRL